MIAAPYDPSHWQDYARLQRILAGRKGFLVNEDANINAIVYANHRPGALVGYAFSKWNILSSLLRLDTDPDSKAWQNMTDKQRARAEEERQIWLTIRNELDLDADLRCPMMRAYRLYKYICDTTNNFQCGLGPDRQEMFEIVHADVNERRACTGIMAVPGHELFYNSITVDLSAPKG